MLRLLTTLLIIIAVFVLADIYLFNAFKTALNTENTKFGTFLYLIITLAFYAIIVAFYVALSLGHSLPKTLNGYFVTIFLAITLFKVCTILVLFIEDIFRAGQWLISKFSGSTEIDLSRKRVVSSIAIVIGLIPFSAMLRGMFSNAYNFKIHKPIVEVKGLPKSFEKLNIVQISDLHTGSMLYPERLLKAVNMINDLQPDLVFFTGDIVNRLTQEAYPFVNVLKKIKAKKGVYSVLGNHDYGYRFKEKEDKTKNREKMLELHREKLGWNLLLNENDIIDLDGHHLAIIGVENTSAKPYFGNYGNLKQAAKGCENCAYKILLSHDPSHWQHEVVKDFKDIDLTFSGHTHGFQFGVEIPWLKWSPAKYMYKEWAGLYENKNQKLYVNRGIGHLGYPGRVGILPEITFLKLKSV